MAADDVRQVVYEVLSDPMNIPSTFWDYATQNWLKDAPVFPISQVFGFTQFVPQQAIIITGGTSLTTTSTSPTDLSTPGPTLSNLADGNYLIWFGANISNATSTTSYMGVKVNATEPVAADAATNIGVTTGTPFCGMTITKALSNGGSNTLKGRYWVDAGTGGYQRCWIAALKYSNL